MQERGNLAGEYSYNTNQRIARYAFGYGLAASLIWHLFWIFWVTISITPVALSKGLSSNVTFLGAILDEKSIFAYGRATGINDKAVVKHPPSLEIDGVSGTDNLEINYIKRPIFKREFDILEEKESKLATKDEFMGSKQIPLKPFDKVKVLYKAYPLEIKGPVRFREVIYKPDLPSYLRWDESLGVDLDRLGDSFNIELKFWVSADGKVELVERISSSGHPTVDLVGIRYLKGWQFAPLPLDESKEKQWGIIKLNFSLAKDLKIE